MSEGHYTGGAGRLYHETKRRIPEAAYPWVARLRAAKIGPAIRAGDVVAEFGVGTGWNLAALSCRRRIGFDVGDFLRPVVEAHGIEFVERWEDVPRGLADVVICHHTLEHVRDPAGALDRMRRVLRVGGRLLLYVPFERERRYRRYDAREPNHHLFSWNPQSLGHLVAECGYQVERVAPGLFGYDRFAAVWAWRLGAGERGFRVLRRALHVVRPLHEVRLQATTTGSGAFAD